MQEDKRDIISFTLLQDVQEFINIHYENEDILIQVPQDGGNPATDFPVPSFLKTSEAKEAERHDNNFEILECLKSEAELPADLLEEFESDGITEFAEVKYMHHLVACEDVDMDDLEARLKYRDESYVEMLLRKIDEKGISDADCYNKAQINKANFNKIKNIEGYKAKKTTLIALGLALELPMDEMNELLNKAGYAFTNSSKLDLIVEYCIEHRLYDINQINKVLYSFDQELLGAGIRE